VKTGGFSVCFGQKNNTHIEFLRNKLEETDVLKEMLGYLLEAFP
jgi:hypothetical protein